MVRHRFILLLTAIALLTASALSAKEYNLGDKAEADIKSPVPLVVVDPEATGALKEKEARRVLVVYRYYPQAIDEVEAAFDSTFAKTRSSFLDAVKSAFHDGNLSEEELSSNEFRRLVNSFQKQNLLFPVGTNLARIWAAGESDHDLAAPLAQQLRQTMKSLVRSEVSPDDIWVGSTIRLISLAENETLTERVVAERGSNIYKTNFVSLPRAKSEFQSLFPDEHAAAAYAASFIKPNCLMETEFTRQVRAKRTEGILAADRYQPGELIVRQGQLVDKKIKAALDQLKTEVKPEPQPQPSSPQLAAIGPVNAEPKRDWTFWLVGTLTVGFFVLLATVWTLVRRRTQVSLLPAIIHGGPVDAAAAGTNSSDESWRQRALVAEQRVEQAQTMARAGLIAHLAQWLSDKMTRKLISQRSQLLDAHQTAAIEMAELEARLVKIHAPLQERLRTYERRIAELEKELLVKGEENRELIKAKIQLVRKQLAIEREKNRLEFN